MTDCSSKTNTNLNEISQVWPGPYPILIKSGWKKMGTSHGCRKTRIQTKRSVLHYLYAQNIGLNVNILLGLW